MPLTVTVTGASGFVGHHLCQALVDAGHTVRAMTRRPDDYTGAGDAVYGDVSDTDSLGPALDGADAAYYLVHSLDQEDFESADAQAAKDFSAAAAKAGLRRIVYLGGLGREDQDLSAHLRSRREVEHLLAGGGVPVTVLRAAIVVGHGGISWEITRQLVDHLPAMVVPHWTTTRTQPIALRDAVAYLLGVLEPAEAEGRVFEIGGPDVLTYAQMMQRASQVIKHRPLPMVAVPLLTPRLSSRWLAFVTDVDTETARNLIDSMSNEVVVHDDAIKEVVPRRLLGYDDAVREAMAERKRSLADASAD
ncbi:MAG TPA: NAD(P)H-binding protein [Friedmanniella sp.]